MLNAKSIINGVIPVNIKYVTDLFAETIHINGKRDVLYFKPTKTKPEAADIDDLKSVKKSKVLMGLIETANSADIKTGKRKSKKTESAEAAISELNNYSFYVKSVVDEKDIEELLKLDAQIKELEERKKSLNSLISSEAMVYYNNNGRCMEDIVTEHGTISSNVAYNITPNKIKTLKKLLKDTGGDYVVSETVYSLNGKAVTAIKSLVSGNYDKTPEKDFINELLKNSKKNSGANITVTYEEIITGMKSSPTSNTKYFMKLFDVDEAFAWNMANKYERMKNYKLILELIESSGVDIKDEQAVNDFKKNVLLCLSVKTVHRLTVQSKSE